MKVESSVTISVLGSAAFSETLPLSREIFSVNGGVRHIEQLAIRSSEVTALFPSGYFGLREVKPESELLIRNAPYKKILLRESLRGLSYPEPNLSVSALAETVEMLSYLKMMKLWTSEINFPQLLGTALKPDSFLNSTLSFLQCMKQDRKKERLASVILSANGNKVSSGVAAAMVAASVAQRGEEIHIFGITSRRLSYPYKETPDNLSLAQRANIGHLFPDLRMLSAMRANPNRKIVIHDEGLKEAVSAFGT